jgi:hypothetical protein
MANVEMQYILWGQKEVYKRWMETVKLNFRALESVRELERRVADLRDQKRTVEQGVDLKLYRHYKCELQQRWMNYYEDKLVDELEGAMKQVDPNRLAVIVLPEAMICDYVTEDEAKENGLRARGYVNPLYEETVRKILGPSVSGGAAAARIISDEDGNKTLLKFTADHGQALLFAGTVWWKQWNENYPKGIIFNSAPVFYQGRCCFMWDKQFASEVDGLKGINLTEQWIKYRINEMPVASPSAEPVQYPANLEGMDTALYRFLGADVWRKRGILSSLTADYNLAGTPLLEIECQTGERLLFGVDICRDNIVLFLEKDSKKLITDLYDFIDRYGEAYCQISTAEYFARSAASVNLIRADGSCSVTTGEERKIDISVVIANYLTYITNQARYHACKADACDYGKSVSVLFTKEEEELTPLHDHFFLLSDVVWTEAREE